MIRTILPALFLCLSLTAGAQYTESFNTADKGILLGTCTGTFGTSCASNDFSGVTWKVNGAPIPSVNIPGVGNNTPNPFGLEGIDTDDYFKTIAGGKLESKDMDGEVYWESPILNISAAGAVMFSVDLEWDNFDGTPTAAYGSNTCAPGFGLDYIKVQYSVNGGAFTTLPSIAGSSACATVGYLFPADTPPLNGTGTATASGITGSTLVIRVLVSNNGSAELVRIAEVRVPTAGVTTGCASPNITTIITPTGSCNPNSGNVQVTASGATPGYNVAWGGTSSGNPAGIEIASSGGSYSITSLAAGAYTITVTDAASCSATTSVTVTTAAALSLSTQVLNTSCSNTADGEINLGVSNGVPPYKYDWSNDGAENPDNDLQDLTFLVAGTYTVTVTDNAGCSATTSATVGASSSGPYLETFSTPNRGYLTNFVDDFAGVNWSMSNWDNQPPAAFGRDNNDYFQTTAGGKLEAFDLDQEVCWLSPVLNIASSGAVTFNVPVTWNQFDNEDYVNVSYSLNGAAFVTMPNAVGGGAGTIQYPFPTSDQSGTTTITKTGLTGSTLQIRACASSNNDAETVQFDNIGVPQNVSLCLCPTITFTATPTATCSGGSNGQIAVTGVMGGAGPYMYSKDNGANYQSGATFTGLAAGTYQVVVKDANNCTSGATAVMVGTNLFTSGTVFKESMGTAPSTTAIATHEAANSFDNDGFTMSGTADVRNTSPSSGYTGASGLGNIFFTNSGTASFQIADINTSAYPAGTLALSFGLLKTTTASTGSEMSVQVSSDGTNYTPLTFSVPSGTGTANIWQLVSPTGSIPSTANLRIRFTNTSTTPQFRVDDVVLSWTLPSASITPGGPTTFCSGGSVNLTASNGSSWLWSTTATTQSITAGTTGGYSVVITAPNGCTASAGPTNVTVNPLPPCSVAGANSACPNSTGNTFSAPGGMSAYSWSVSGSGTSVGATNTSTVTVTAGASGTFTVNVTVTDANGCTSSCFKTVSINTPPSPTITGPSSVCNGGNVLLDAGAGYASYAWSNGGGSGQTATFSNITLPTTYTVTVTDGGGCVGTGTHAVTVNANPAPAITGPSSVCNGGNVLLDAGAGYASYAWSNGGGSGQTATFSNITLPTTYTVTVADGNGCVGTGTHAVTVNANPTPTITGPAGPVCTGGSALLDAGAGYNGYAWSNGGGSGQTATFNNINANTTYTVTVTDANGCAGTDTYTVTVQSCLVEFSGKIIWEHDDVSGVNNATVNLTGSATGSDVSDINGDYMITTALTTGSFTLKPTKNLNKTNGLSAADATAVQQHVNLSVPITDPYKMVCADVNKSNSITTLDASLITQVLLGNPQANAIFNTSWRFTPTTPALNNPPWGFAEQRTYTNISGPQTNQDFFGMKLGDVVAAYANPANFGAGDPEASGLVLRVKDRVLQSGETLEIDFSADQLDDLAAFQFALAFDPAQLQFEAVEPTGSLPVTADHFGTYSAASGEIRAVWSQATGIRVEEATPVFRLRFKALQTGVQLSNALQMDDSILPALSYNSKLAESKVELRFSEATGTNDPATVSALQLQVRPNPFREETTVSFSLPAAGEAQLRVLDVNGRELLRINNTYPAGQHSETLRLDGITASGVLTCELVTPFGVATRKMVLAR